MRLGMPKNATSARAIFDRRGTEVRDEGGPLFSSAVERSKIECDGFGEAAQQRFRSVEGRMPEPIAATLDLETMEPRKVGVRPEHRPAPDVLEAPAAHDGQRRAWVAGNLLEDRAP
jgi:hypothetical protein